MLAHICIVSDQPLPNLLPVLHPELKPCRVYLLCSAQQQEKGNDQAQKKIFEDLGCEVEIFNVSDAYGTDDVEQSVDEIRIANENRDCTLLLNVTGGTKPMSIAAFEGCFCHSIGVFYVRTPEVIWLKKSDNSKMESISKLHIPGYLPLRQFIEAHNMKLLKSESNRISETQSSLIQYWADRAQKYSSEYSLLNYYASSAKDDLRMSIEPKKHKGNFKNLLDELVHEEYIQPVDTEKSSNSKNKLQYEFITEEKRIFSNGGWLEEYVFHQLCLVKDKHPHQITDLARNVEVESIRSTNRYGPKSTNRYGPKNELDIIAIIDHTMWIFECKTRTYKIDDGRNRYGEEMIYKLAGIMKNIGGIRTCGCVVSFNKLRDVEKSRAELFDISVIDGVNIKGNSFRSKLIQMFKLNR